MSYREPYRSAGVPSRTDAKAFAPRPHRRRARKTCLLPAAFFFVANTMAAVQDPRLILIKVDGLPAAILDAAIDPGSPEAGRLPAPELFQQAHRKALAVFNRQILLPNVEHYFYRSAYRAGAMYSGTLALSAPAWAMIDSGQPSVIKNNYYFNRASGELGGHLDGLRESLSMLLGGAGRTIAVWQFDLLRVPLLVDMFDRERSWTSIQVLYRQRPHEQLSQLGKLLFTAGATRVRPLEFIKKHLSRFVYHPDYPEWNDRASAVVAARKVLERDAGQNERFDFISAAFLTLDHQFHVDPNYDNVLAWLVKLDSWIGSIFASVEKSARRDDTLVALLSDHGADFEPSRVNFTLPINRWLRERDFGGHTVLSPVAEDNVHAVTVPIRGVDFARVYESPHSPYGTEHPYGEKGYITAFTAYGGSPRFDAYLRNSDLNRIHLLLLEVLASRGDQDRLRQVHALFSAAMHQIMPWLGVEREALRSSAEALSHYASFFASRKDAHAKDALSRLQSEVEGYRRKAAALDSLSAIPDPWTEWLPWARSDFKISELIPKGYLGPPNDLNRLREYVTGWEEPRETRWQNGHPRFRTVDYPELFCRFTATSGNATAVRTPFRFFAAAVPPEHLTPASDQPLRQAVWLSFSQQRGQAVLLESYSGQISYRPIGSLQQIGKAYRFERRPDSDPLELGSRTETGEWLSRDGWAARVAEADDNLVPVILADLFGRNYEDLLLSETFARRVEAEGLDLEAHRRALRFRFGMTVPDFRVWMNPGWNVNPNHENHGATHGGFRALETRVLFSLWGGQALQLPRGQVLSEARLTPDILPTLLWILRRLEPGNAVRVPLWNSNDTVLYRPAGRPLPLVSGINDR